MFKSIQSAKSAQHGKIAQKCPELQNLKQVLSGAFRGHPVCWDNMVAGSFNFTKVDAVPTSRENTFSIHHTFCSDHPTTGCLVCIKKVHHLAKCIFTWGTWGQLDFTDFHFGLEARCRLRQNSSWNKWHMCVLERRGCCQWWRGWSIKGRGRRQWCGGHGRWW